MRKKMMVIMCLACVLAGCAGIQRTSYKDIDQKGEVIGHSIVWSWMFGLSSQKIQIDKTKDRFQMDVEKRDLTDQMIESVTEIGKGAMAAAAGSAEKAGGVTL